MRHKFPISFALIIIALATLGGGVLSQNKPFSLTARSTTQSSFEIEPTFNDAQADINRIEDDYRDAVSVVAANYTGDIDYARANQAAIQGMLMTLDPHSSFFPTDDFRKLKEDQNSLFYGIGVSILRHRDGVYVQTPLPGTPAARAGLRFGDRIVEVDGKDAREWSGAEVSKNVRGALGTPVTLKLERAGEEVPIYRTITRDSVASPSIPVAFLAQPGTGYVGLTAGFQSTTEEELRQAIARLQKQGARQFVLDMRNNPGGLLDEAISVAGQFLPLNATVVSVRGRAGETPKVYRNRENETTDVPLIILINRGSASASEIVAGAMQDYGRGLVVGETSFGKGLVQRVFQLPFGNGLTLTTAKYFTPYGRMIQREYAAGSFYDYYVRHTNQAANASPANKSNQLPTDAYRPNPTATPAPMPTPSPTPSPSGTPVKTAGGRIFYGGGGITPDVEIKALDLSKPGRGRIFETAFYFTRELIGGRINGLEQYRYNASPFETNAAPPAAPLVVNDDVIARFKEYAQRDTTANLSVKQIDADLDFVRLRLQAEYATATQGGDAATRVLLESDPQLLKAIELFPQAKQLADSVRGQIVIS